MRYKINFECEDGSLDWFVVYGETIEEIQRMTLEGLKKRGGKNEWSEELT